MGGGITSGDNLTYANRGYIKGFHGAEKPKIMTFHCMCTFGLKLYLCETINCGWIRPVRILILREGGEKAQNISI